MLRANLANDTTLTILREEKSLRACIRYINHFKEISGLGTNIDKTMVVPIGKFFNPGTKICPELPLKWKSDFTLLGLNIDNKLNEMQENFERVHIRTCTLINDWKSRRLPIEGRIAISKFLLVSQYKYIATVLVLSLD